MLIVSDFHDFYDSCSATGVDKTVVFQRKKKIEAIDLNDLKLPYTESCRSKIRGQFFFYTIRKMVVGFCGGLYPLVCVEKLDERKELFEKVVFYKPEDLYSYLDSEKIQIDGRFSYFSDFEIKNREKMNKFFLKTTWKKLEFLFRQKNLATFLIGRGISKNNSDHEVTLLSNPRLFELNFMKVKDPFSAYQEIYMFISGFLGVPEKKQLKISDKDMAASKGHDSPYSFKKPPGGGPWR
jgi:hypothetical protein